MPKKGMETVRRPQIINAALRCVAELGFEGITLEIVAAKAGVSKGIVSYYFKSKRDLLLHSFRAFLEYYNKIATDCLHPGMTAFEMLAFTIDMTLFPERTAHLIPALDMNATKEKENHESSVYIPREILGDIYLHFFSKVLLDKEFQEIQKELYLTYFQGITAILDMGRDSGELLVMDTQSEALGFMALLDGFAQYSVIRFSPIKNEKVREICLNYIRRWLK